MGKPPKGPTLNLEDVKKDFAVWSADFAKQIKGLKLDPKIQQQFTRQFMLSNSGFMKLAEKKADNGSVPLMEFKPVAKTAGNKLYKSFEVKLLPGKAPQFVEGAKIKFKSKHFDMTMKAKYDVGKGVIKLEPTVTLKVKF